ncbi:PP2C family protein-serine/threonine phosphatase [Streptomyces sp. NBC_01497]|uniref:PP2C family protein-serine/threonine phosphatase n=1 Tax=Streptomyces sp. NBC_01497 TaxID=2903885 RepID=UPI002E2F71C6|nr:PP2C family protein-serine/threonine phosphatase [Streptomyces sp. NBC_01497]
MDIRWLDDFPSRASGRLLAVPLALIVVITTAGLVSPNNVHLGPMLVIAPALTASFAGPWQTAMIGTVAAGAQALLAELNGGLGTPNHVWQFIALVVLSALVVFFCYLRERHSRQLSRVRVVAETAQRVLLRPPPQRVGPLRVAWRYRTADTDAQMGGDLFAVVHTGRSCSRVIIGDVRGKGLAAIGEASVVLGAFRESARHCETLSEMVQAMEDSVGADIEDAADTEQDPGEHFVTALVLDLPDGCGHGTMINCGHPPPLLLRDGQVTVLHAGSPAPPLGLGNLGPSGLHSETFAFTDGDTLLLYTDGVIEARSPQGSFYPLAERAATFPAAEPEELLQRLLHEVSAHTEGRLADDVAVLAITLAPAPARSATTMPSPS